MDGFWTVVYKARIWFVSGKWGSEEGFKRIRRFRRKKASFRGIRVWFWAKSRLYGLLIAFHKRFRGWARAILEDFGEFID